MLNKLKEYVTVIVGFIITIGGLLMFFNRDKFTDTMVKDGELRGEESVIDDEITKVEDSVGEPVPDLDDKEIEDYWNEK